MFVTSSPFLLVKTPSDADRVRRAWSLGRGFHSEAVLPIVATASRELRAFYVRDEEVSRG